MQMQSEWLRLALCAVLLGIISVSINNCGLSEDGPGAVFVDPGKYALYDCNTLGLRWKELITREKDLRNLIEKSSESAAGGVIGSLAYRSDYDSVLTEKVLVQRRVADLKCSVPPDYKSDDAIR